ncbi:hypothetical protein F4811DRAFT_535365 [Daldinia bambusicola]|nr:hypothetical protein F4811DRAFT_535365 [Daldinia bambusicola]
MKICTNEKLYEVYACICGCVYLVKWIEGDELTEEWISDVVIIATIVVVHSLAMWECPFKSTTTIR